MKSKQQTPLAYLMALLGVSLADLGEYLYVAQTSVSKWKTGSRPLRPESPHFDGIVEYFVALARDPNRGAKLTEVMEKLYPEGNAGTPRGLAQCLRGFLVGKMLPSTALHVSMRERGKLYSAQVDVYSGLEGRRNAFLQLLSFAASQKKPASLMLVDERGMASAAGDMEYLRQLSSQLVEVMDAGGKIRFLMRRAEPEMLASRLAPVLAHENLQIRLLPPHVPVPRESIFCLLGNQMLLRGMTLAGKPLYSSVQSDDFTLVQYRALFESLWEEADAAFARSQLQNLTPEAFREMLANTVGEALDLRMASLPYLTMGRALLMEVLDVNGIGGHNWRRALGCFDALRGVPVRLFLPARALRRPDETQQETELPLLSAMMGKPVRIRPGQVRRHMLDTAAFLRSGKGLKILLQQGKTAAEDGRFAVFCRRNANGGYLNLRTGVASVTMRPALVECFSAYYDSAASALTAQAACPGYVAGTLEQEALRTDFPP